MRVSEAKHAFITGGSSGMGLGIADALAKHGVAVTIADIFGERAEAVAAERGERFQAIVLDASDRAAWPEAKAKAEATFRPVDILVNNAGIGPDGKEIADIDPKSFDRLMAVDVTGVLNGIVTFAADMRARRTGFIVNNSSVLGIVQGYPTMGSYSAAKAAVVSLSEALRAELAPHGVGVGVLCPGPVATDLDNSTLREGGEIGQWPDVKRMSAADVGECVVRGIDNNEDYIISHPDHIEGPAARATAIRNAFLRQTPEQASA
ncbi:SDR family oxidoreductase [Sphingomonas aracearum]|uniref:SDR family NAD(P)-dependent oxidoreductase n=1 Tax=Sphingomonas aracearum TaxID=2283317 RepID=A0A369VT61_9SPHN|nr:SDR family oxidoreductase [Sphingomonas aracearum]RDE05594.1 SDR family NAD(P)-dependent oxidoreductase [Sphingomonas aracearum]